MLYLKNQVGDLQLEEVVDAIFVKTLFAGHFRQDEITEVPQLTMFVNLMFRLVILVDLLQHSLESVDFRLFSIKPIAGTLRISFIEHLSVFESKPPKGSYPTIHVVILVSQTVHILGHRPNNEEFLPLQVSFSGSFNVVLQ